MAYCSSCGCYDVCSCTPKVQKKQIEYWYNINRQPQAISEMDEDHIEACLRMLVRNRGWRQEYLPVFEAELKRRSSKLYKALK